MARNFCNDEDEFMKPVFKNGVYDNPFPTSKWAGRMDFLKSPVTMLRDSSGVPGKNSVGQNTNP